MHYLNSTVSRDGNLLIRYGINGLLEFWNTNSFLEIQNLQTCEITRNDIPAGIFGNNIITFHDGSSIVLLERRSGPCEDDYVFVSNDSGLTWKYYSCRDILGVYADKTRSVLLSERQIMIYTGDNEEPEKITTPLDVSIQSLGVSDDNRYIAFTTNDGVLFFSDDYGKTSRLSLGCEAFSMVSVSLSGDGSTCLVIGFEGKIRISRDYGKTWDEIHIDSVSKKWYSASSSYTGSDIIICDSECNTFYISWDNGKNWVTKRLPPDLSVRKILRIAGSSIILLCYNIEGVYRSEDGGESWKKFVLPDCVLYDGAVSQNGKYIALCGRNSSDEKKRLGVIYFSEDYGKNFNLIFQYDDMEIIKISVSNNGDLASACIRKYFVYSQYPHASPRIFTNEEDPADIHISPDGESICILDKISLTVTEVKSITDVKKQIFSQHSNLFYRAGTFSDDGRTVAISWNNYLYISRDTGATWNIEPRYSPKEMEVSCLSISGNGDIVYVFDIKGCQVLDKTDSIRGYESYSENIRWLSAVCDYTGDVVCAAYSDSSMFGVVISFDRGRNWSNLYKFESPLSVSGITLSMSSCGRKIAVSVKHRHKVTGELDEILYYSDDLGITWKNFGISG